MRGNGVWAFMTPGMSKPPVDGAVRPRRTVRALTLQRCALPLSRCNIQLLSKVKDEEEVGGLNVEVDVSGHEADQVADKRPRNPLWRASVAAALLSAQSRPTNQHQTSTPVAHNPGPSGQGCAAAEHSLPLLLPLGAVLLPTGRQHPRRRRPGPLRRKLRPGGTGGVVALAAWISLASQLTAAATHSAPE